jgi:hypothetical protein
MEKMTHAEYIADVRHRAGELAAAIVAGETDILDGCWALGPLLGQAELEGDPDAEAIGVICSELDGLPVGSARGQWAPEALNRLAPQLESTAAWATRNAMPAIQSLAYRFGA